MIVKCIFHHFCHILWDPPKGHPLKSSASAACSNLNVLTPQWTQECIKRHSKEFLCMHCKLTESCCAETTLIGMQEYKQRRANTCLKILCWLLTHSLVYWGVKNSNSNSGISAWLQRVLFCCAHCTNVQTGNSTSITKEFHQQISCRRIGQDYYGQVKTVMAQVKIKRSFRSWKFSNQYYRAYIQVIQLLNGFHVWMTWNKKFE